MNKWLVVGLGALVFGYLLWPKSAQAATPTTRPRLPSPKPDDQRTPPMPRGIRNHNPMNLRYVESIEWVGQIGPDDAGYARFHTVEHGIRAGVKNLVNGYFKRGINTPRTIISRYAPSHENPTDSYINFIAKRMGIPADAPIEPTRHNLTNLATHIIRFENGVQPYNANTIERGVDMALE